MEEQDLIKRCQSGDIKAFEPLYRAHVDMAVRTAFLIVRDWAEAEDAAQEAFVKAFQHIRSFRIGEPFRPWLYRIVVNEAKRLGAKVRKLPTPFQISDDILPGVADAPEDTLLNQERKADIWTAVDSLSDDHRMVLVLKYSALFSEADLAAVLGIPQTTAKSRLHEARKRLLALLNQNQEVLPS